MYSKGFISSSILIIVVILLAAPFYWFYQKSTLSFDVDRAELVLDQRKTENSEISEVEIERLSIKLPVVEADIVGGNWEYKKDSASHLFVSAKPFDNNNIVIFAKNKEGLFANLLLIKKGDEIRVTTKDEYVSIYKVDQTIEVSSYQNEYVLPANREILTLFTDSGFLGSKRFVVIAYPIN